MRKQYAVFGFGVVVLIVGLLFLSGLVRGQEKTPQNSRLAVVWSSSDPDVARQACFMYTGNAKKQKWFDEVTLIVWGPSAMLLAGNKALQAKIKTMRQDGVKIQACQACTDSYGVTEQLRAMGIEVKYMGKPLTDLIQQNWHILTF